MYQLKRMIALYFVSTTKVKQWLCNVITYACLAISLAVPGVEGFGVGSVPEITKPQFFLFFFHIEIFLCADIYFSNPQMHF